MTPCAARRDALGSASWARFSPPLGHCRNGPRTLRTSNRAPILGRTPARTPMSDRRLVSLVCLSQRLTAIRQVAVRAI